jgi:hypothetical protein
MSGSAGNSVRRTLIEIGIGSSWARWLMQNFDLRSVHDLAALSPDDIEARVREEAEPPARRPSRKVIETWVRKAKEASEKEGEAPTGPLPEATAADQVAPEDETAEKGAARGERPVITDLRGTVGDGDAVELMSLIRIDKPWSVTLEWTVESGLLPEGHEWLLQIALRPLAPGRRLLLTSETARGGVRVGEEGSHHYHLELPVGAVTTSETPFRAMAVLLYRPGPSGQASPAGSVDLGVLHFYQLPASTGEPVARPGPTAAAVPGRGG